MHQRAFVLLWVPLRSYKYIYIYYICLYNIYNYIYSLYIYILIYIYIITIYALYSIYVYKIIETYLYVCAYMSMFAKIPEQVFPVQLFAALNHWVALFLHTAP